MNEKLSKTLIFFRITDADGLISITNLATFIVLYKLATAPVVGLSEVGMLFTILLAYQGKKIINLSAPKEPHVLDTQVQELTNKLDEVQSKVTGLSLQTGLIKK